MTDPTHLMLSGIVGSHGYGLAHPGSDIDIRGVFAYPTELILGLDRHRDTLESKRPADLHSVAVDTVYWEAAKFINLALACNPNTIELLWLDDFETIGPWGTALLSIRKHLLSGPMVRNRYLGYATAQVKMIENGKGPTEKHARHVYRLLAQGYDCYLTGRLTVRLQPAQAEAAREFGRRVADGDTALARATLDLYGAMFDNARTPLPGMPDRDRAEGWLQAVRADHYQRRAD